MKEFTTRLINRHLYPGNNVLPLARMKFEPESPFSISQPLYDSFEKNVLKMETKEKHFKNNEPVKNTSHDLKSGNIIRSTDTTDPVVNNKPEYKQGLEDIIKKNESFKNPDSVIKQNIPLSRPDENKPLTIGKVEKNSFLTEFIENKIEKELSNKVPVDFMTKSGVSAKRKTHLPISLNPEFIEKVDSDKSHIQKTDKQTHTEFNNSNEIISLGQTDTFQKVLRKDISATVVKPAYIEPEFLEYRKSTLKKEIISTHAEGTQRIPKWIGDWKSIVNYNNEIKPPQIQPTPTVKVNIGRIEVRAVMQQTPSTPKPIETSKPKLSLDDYLKKPNND